MKTILAFIFLSFLFQAVSAQKHYLGKYSTTDHSSKLSIEFVNDSIFEYEQFVPFELTHNGNGSYFISNDTLTLQFDSLSNIQDSVSIINRPCKQEDTVEIHFYIYDGDMERWVLPFVNVSIYLDDPHKHNTESTNILIGGTTDINGRCTISLERKERNIWAVAKFIGYESGSLKLNNANCSSIKLGMKSRIDVIIAGKTVKYKIKRFNAKQMILLNLETGYTDLLKKEKP